MSGTWFPPHPKLSGCWRKVHHKGRGRPEQDPEEVTGRAGRLLGCCTGQTRQVVSAHEGWEATADHPYKLGPQEKALNLCLLEILLTSMCIQDHIWNLPPDN